MFEKKGQEAPQPTWQDDRDYRWEPCLVCQREMMVTQVLPRSGAPPGVETWSVAA